MARDPLVDGLMRRSVGEEGFFPARDNRILGWIREAVREGDLVNASDPVYEGMDDNQDYVLGQQLAANRPQYLPNVVVNRTKKAIRTHVAALTDIRPLFGYKTKNTRFDTQAHLLNNLTLVWWLNAFVDLRLAECAKYALTLGTGDLIVEFDPFYNDGDTRLMARDPRDTLPIRASRTDTLQDWRGVILREAYSPGVLQSFYPDMPAEAFTPSEGSIWSNAFTRFRRAMKITTPVSTLDGLRTTKGPAGIFPEVGVVRVWLKDGQRNENTGPVLMGVPGTDYAYKVAPGGKLYPRGRLIVATEKRVTFDGPNPFWHGMFPVVRMKLDPWPWNFLGLPLINDTKPMQDGINGVVNNILTAFSRIVNQGLIFDSKAIPEGTYKRFDPRVPNFKLKVNPTLGQGVKLAEVPNLPPWSFEFASLLLQQFDDMTEMANLQQLMTLRQMPSADTIEKYYQALTPGLRLEGRLLEVFLRELAEMVKVNIFQYYSQAKRVLILGDAGQQLQDFDFDPGNLVPAMKEGDEGYVPELDRGRSRDERAQHFHKLFAFYIKPNSMLAMHSQEEQMKYLQLSRQGYIDFWTLLERLEVPNVGRPPAVPLPDPDYKPPPVQTDPQTGAALPPPPPPMIVREPVTVTERLIAQQQLGIGQTVSPAGRKATGQESPQIEQKGDRTTVTES
jgi:hypothetical protein